MKKGIAMTGIIFLFSLLLIGCDRIPHFGHIHHWQAVSGEHAVICTDCQEKRVTSEPCNFVRTNCEKPKECTVCHATDDSPTEKHNWKRVGQRNACWAVYVTYVCSKCNMESETHGDYGIPDHIWSEKTENGQTTFSCTRCSDSYEFASEIASFSYAEVLEKYKIGDPGVRHENFYFNDEFEITSVIDVVERAELQLPSSDYDTIAVSFDSDADVWCVDFRASEDGVVQSVYVQGNGLICYAVTHQEKYKLEISYEDIDMILNELKDSYEAGEKVTIKLGTITEHYYVVSVNGVEIERDNTISDDWWDTYYTFTMPSEDVIVTIEDRWVEIPEQPSATTVTQYGYVVCVTSEGFVAHFNSYGKVFVENPDSVYIEEFDTVIVEYYIDNLIEESGEFETLGQTDHYSYTLEAVSIRVADPSKGEEVFG